MGPLNTWVKKSCEIKGGGQEMVAMMLMLINSNNTHTTVIKFF